VARRFFGLIVFILFIAIGCEVLLYILLPLLEGHLPQLSQMQAKREAVATATETVLDQRSQQQAGEALHPYVGFTQDPERRAGDNSHAGIPISSFGMIDDKLPFNKGKEDEQTIRIAIFGGSVAWWLSADGEEVLTAKIKRATGKDVVLYRLALGAYKQPQQLMLLNYLYTLGTYFDVVVNLDGFNEMTIAPIGLASKRINPLYPANWELLLGESGSLERLKSLARLLDTQADRTAWAKLMSAPLIQESSLAAVLWYLRDSMLADHTSELRNDVQVGPGAMLSYAARGFDVSPLIEGKGLMSLLASSWANASLAMNETAKLMGAEYLHFLQPNQYVPNGKPLTAEEHERAYDETGLYKVFAAEGYPMFRAASKQLSEAGVQYHDLSMIFSTTTESIYVDECCHLNAAGSKQMADQIATKIVETLDK